MKKDIALITYDMSFTIGSLKTVLEDMEYNVHVIKPYIKQLNEIVDDVDLMIFCVSGMDTTMALNIMVYMKDVCLENNKYVLPIGDKDELLLVEKNLPDIIMPLKVEKPFSVESFHETMEKLVDTLDFNINKKKILVIDDNMTSLVRTQKLLEKKYNVQIASSAMQGIISLSRTVPDLILIDYMMPVCNGVQCLAMIRHETETEKIPVIFLTGVKDTDMVRDAIKEKPDGYLLKDMPAREFREFIDDFFYKRRVSLEGAV